MSSSTPPDTPSNMEAKSSARDAQTAAEPADPPAEEEQADKPAEHALPTECTKKDAEVCAPPRAFARAVCQDTFPGVALYMFRAGTPWTRGYLRGKVQAWNASGGASVSGELAFDEEVLLLHKRTAAPGGMQVSGYTDGYDALRWDGSCVTLSSGEVTLSKPPRPGHADITWRHIDSNQRDAMKHNDEKVQQAFRAYGRECRGATMGEVSDKCIKAIAKLGDAVVAYVRAGGELPLPAKLP
ncbi:MAG: hypothetical protein JW940_36645 [Polyangiaceae bacterium]|nr:hypothetical protein [Polyangiaceae bacterium]